MEPFLETYKILNAGNLHLLREIYTDEIRFIDPAHEIKGLERLRKYFANLYENIATPQFCFTHHLQSGNDGYVQWEMAFSHPRLNRGRSVAVAGASYLRFDADGKVFFHRDYFDLGAMLYEQVPMLGWIVTTIKRRLGA